MIKAIETSYNGYRFRSRLEARWAVFFDAIHVRYRYELTGYDLGGIPYLPDFELKGPPRTDEQGDIFQDTAYVEIKPNSPTKYEWNKAVLLCYESERPVHIFAGEIGTGETGLDLEIYTLMFSETYLPEFLSGVGRYGQDTTLAMPPYFCCTSAWAQCKKCGGIGLMRQLWAIEPRPRDFCAFCKTGDENILDSRSVELLSAVAKARSARFEHGQTPQVQG